MTVVITGASKGIGRAVAEIFAANGYDLLLCSRGELALYNAMEELLNRFPAISIKARPADLSIKEQALAFGAWTLEQTNHSGIDILVNNAGLFEPGSIHNEAEGVLESQLAVNLFSAYHLTRSLLPSMIKSVNPDKKLNGPAPHIFNLCSIASLNAYHNGGAYSISKFAMYGFSKNLREEMKPYGIKVTHVIPGATLTDSWSGSNIDPARVMMASDIAKMIFAASQLSPQACVEELIIRPQLGDL